MTGRRTTALVVGVLLLLPALALLVAGGSLGAARLSEGRDGYLSRTLDPVRSGSAAVVSPDVGVVVDAGVPSRLLTWLDLDVRLQVRPLDGSGPLFVGLGPSVDVTRYLAGVTHDRVARAEGSRLVLEPVIEDASTLPAPADQSFWTATATANAVAAGPGGTRLDWRPTEGSYSVVVMNADGSTGVQAEVVAAGRSGALGPVAVVLLVAGALLAAAAVTLLVRGLRGPASGPPGPGAPSGPARSRPSPLVR